MSWTSTPPSAPGWYWQRAHYGEYVEEPEPRLFCYSTHVVDGKLVQWPEGGLGFNDGYDVPWTALAAWSDRGANGDSGWRDWWDEPIATPPSRCGVNVWTDQRHREPCALQSGHDGPHRREDTIAGS